MRRISSVVQTAKSTTSSCSLSRLRLPFAKLCPTRNFALPPHYPPFEDTTPGIITPAKLKALVADNKIESVVVCFPDIYGRLMGKTCDAEYFVESTLADGTHGCDYLLACDMNMTPIPGFKFANWERGYGDVHFVPDLSTLRLMSWRHKTAMVICDLKHHHELVPVAPRTVLRSQIDRAAKLMYTLKAASELEYYIFESTYREAASVDYHPSKMRTISDVVEDYHTLQAAREERFNAPFRRHLDDFFLMRF